MITRRGTLKMGMATLAGTALGASPSRLHEYSWVRGFNYQPSWGSHGIHIWNDFRAATFSKEVDLGLAHFPKVNTLRIWFS